MVKPFIEIRYLLWELVGRDVRSRYVGSFLGVFWSVLNPLFQLIIYTLVFSVTLRVQFGEGDSTGRFAEFLFCALLPWTAFQESSTRSARIFIENSNLIKKMRFPLEALPLSLVLSSLIHQLVGTAIFLIVLVWNNTVSLPHLLLLPVLLLVQAAMMFGVALLISSVNVFFRDVAQIIGVIFMFFFWMTPIVYPKSQAPDLLQLVLNLNPLTHMVDLYRFAFFGALPFSPFGAAYWAGFSLFLLLLGWSVLKRTRSEIVDLV